MAAAFSDNIAAFELLVQRGASTHRRGGSELTALHEAAANGSDKVVRRLLELGAHVDALTIHLVTPLMCAAAWGHSTTVKLPTACYRSGTERLWCNTAFSTKRLAIATYCSCSAVSSNDLVALAAAFTARTRSSPDPSPWRSS